MLGRIKSAKPAVAVSVGVVALLVIGGGSAAARALITGADIKNGSIHLVDLSAGAKSKLHGAKGATGARGATGATGADGTDGTNGVDGAKGDKGDKGDAGADATYVGKDWSIVDSNVKNNGDSYLRAGPDGGTGDGSLGLRTGGPLDKAAFGNQTAFVGDLVSALAHVSYSVFTTDANIGVAANNMPGISIDIDPNVIGSPHSSTLVYAPDNSAAGWSTVDAVNDTGKHWGLTGPFFNSAAPLDDRCGISGAKCTFQEVQAYLADNAVLLDSARIKTVSITKGQDFTFSGAVDNLIINSNVYDFEPFGVVKRSTP